MKQLLTSEEVAMLRGIQERLKSTRPTGKSAEAHVHDAVYDGLSAVIATGQGVISTARDFEDAAKSVHKAVMAR